jgi:DNA polymerase-3 subunit beta
MNKIIVNSQILLKALTYASKVMSKNPSVPILENFLFQVKDEKLTISGSDLQTTFKVSLRVEANKGTEFSACVPAEVMKYLAKLDECPITLAYKEGLKVKKKETDEDEKTYTIEILEHEVDYNKETHEIKRGDNGLAKYSTDNYVDFPKTPEVKTDFAAITSDLFKEFKDLLNYTSTDELRPSMTGIDFQTYKGNFTMVATDGHRLKTVVVPELTDPTEQSNEGKQHFILPNKAAKILGDLKFGTAKNPVNELVLIQIRDEQKFDWENKPTKIDRTNVSFTFALDSFDMELTVRNIDERYPHVWGVIPTTSTTKFTIEKKEILKQIDKAMLFANKTTHQIRIKLNGVNQISAEDLDFSNEYCANLNGTYTGEPIEIGFNARFFKGCIESFGDTVTLEMTEPNRAGVIRNEKSMVLVMPVMLDRAA